MISGRDALGRLVHAVAEAQSRAVDVDGRLAGATERVLQLDAGRAKTLQELARVHVTHLDAIPDAGPGLAEVERRAHAMLAVRDEAAASLRTTLADLEAREADLGRERTAAADALDAAADALDATEAALQARLAQDPTYAETQTVAREAERIAVHADEKATASEAELDAKGAAFREDPLFWYLWRQGYGTPTYRANRWIRRGDAWVARLVGFADARADFARLQEIPVRLRAHAEAVGAVADAHLATLRRLDAEARSAGGVPALEARVAEAEAALAAVDARLEATAAERTRSAAAYDAIAAGEDGGTRDTVAFLAAAFEREDLQALRARALSTPAVEDDALVDRLLELERARQAAVTTAAELREAAKRAQARQADLEDLRRRFKDGRFDRPGSSFPDADLIGTLLTQVLSGVMTRDALWRVFEQQRRYAPPRSDPTFGSGGFGRGSPWGGGRSAPRGSAGPFGGGGFGGTGRASGGFKPGGATRGGGFKTGGSIGRGGGGRRGGFKTGGRF